MTINRQHCQVVVIGAGFAGITAAYHLARAGVDVILLERGPYPGSKNISGGAVYSLPTREILPDFWQEAPVERALTDQQYWLLTESSAVKLGFTCTAFANPPFNKFSVLRADFDRWYAEKAVGAGAQLWTSCQAEELLLERGLVGGVRVSGVRVSGSRSGPIRADLVILAQGVNTLLAEKAGLLPRPKSKNFALYVKEIIALPEEVINERFHLKGDEGAVIGLLGENTAGLPGTGSVYTFKKYLGLNTGASVQQLALNRINPGQLIANLKKHPIIEPLIRGGTTVEYTAHLIPEGGLNAMPTLVFNGMLLVGDSAGLVNGTHGLSLAMFSGKFAAEAAVKALEQGNFSRRGLTIYRKKLEGSFVLKDMRDNHRVFAWIGANPTLIKEYIDLANQLAFQVATVYPVSRRAKRTMTAKEILASRHLSRMLVDAYNTVRVIK